MENNSVSKIIIGFFMIIIGIVLIASVSNASELVTSQRDIVNETIDLSTARDNEGNGINITSSNYTLANVPIGWKTTECPVTAILYGNETADWVVTTDYNIYPASGILQILNSTITGTESIGTNSTFVDYTYCADGYLTEGWSRSIMNLVAGFFALAILGLGLGLFYSVAKDAGIV